MEEFQARLQYRFQNPGLLITALTHPSFGGDYHVAHYQRLEFLGDAVLEFSVSNYLYHELPEVPEGTLTRVRAKLVREETLSQAARRLKIGDLIRLSVGEEKSGGRDKPSILADVMEAVFAAVYLDGGIEEAERIIRLALREELNSDSLTDCLDAKSRLQEFLQKRGEMPTYEFVSVEVPQHAPTFHYRVLNGEAVVGEGAGMSKQAAQLQAAQNALDRMGARHCD